MIGVFAHTTEFLLLQPRHLFCKYSAVEELLAPQPYQRLFLPHLHLVCVSRVNANYRYRCWLSSLSHVQVSSAFRDHLRFCHFFGAQTFSGHYANATHCIVTTNSNSYPLTSTGDGLPIPTAQLTIWQFANSAVQQNRGSSVVIYYSTINYYPSFVEIEYA